MEPTLKKSILEYVIGKRKTLEISGPPRLIATLWEAAESCRSLLHTLRLSSEPERVKEAMERRQVAAKRWKDLTGEDWDI
jgi:hypothetical protein